MANFFMTDFYQYQQKEKIRELEDEGKYVYAIIDVGGNNYILRPKTSFINRYGFLVTDEPLDLGKNNMMEDEEFERLGWNEDPTLVRGD